MDDEPGIRPPEDEVIGCRGLTKRYGDTFAIRELDLSVREGEIFGFLGPNGAGKTTTLRILLGLIAPTAGTARMNGRTIPDPRGLSEVGAMVEEPAFYPWLRGRTNLRVLSQVGAPLSGAAMDDAMERTGIAAAADDKVGTYSQGMRQRLGLAAALMRRPRVLLLDEPTNGLDPAGVRDFRSILREAASDGATVFLSSHLLTEVEHLCDRVAIVNRGSLSAVGTLDELGRGVPTVRVTVDPSNGARALELLRSLRPQEEEAGVLRVAARSGRQVAELLGRGGVYPETLSVGRPSLEDLFMQLTQGEASRAPAGV
jgi:ABC-2 type transport system ATP-binding protein